MVLANLLLFLDETEVLAHGDLDRPTLLVDDSEGARRVKADALDLLALNTARPEDVLGGEADGLPDIGERLLEDAMVLRVAVGDGVMTRLGAAAGDRWGRRDAE